MSVLDLQKIQVYVHPGDVVWADERCELKTITGSCVAICLWHPVLRHGGMAHFMIPSRKEKDARLSGRFGDEAMQILLAQIKKAGQTATDYIYKIFGGASIAGTSQIGISNQQAIRELLDQNGISGYAKDMGGNQSRQIIFHMLSGDVFVKRFSQDWLTK